MSMSDWLKAANVCHEALLVKLSKHNAYDFHYWLSSAAINLCINYQNVEIRDQLKHVDELVVEIEKGFQRNDLLSFDLSEDETDRLIYSKKRFTRVFKEKLEERRMEQSYSISTTNKFHVLLNEDDDPIHLLRLEESSLKKKTKKKEHCLGKTGSDTKEPNDVAAQKSCEKHLISTKQKDMETDPALIRERKEVVQINRPKPRSGSNRAPENLDEGDEFRDFISCERGRCGRGGRCRRSLVFRGGRREYDRHSGSNKSGVKPQEKRDGAGAHNWGTISDDIQDQQTTEPQPDATDSQQLNNEEYNEHVKAQTPGAKVEEQSENAAPEPVEEEEEVLTLDEWKAQQEASHIKAEFNIRKPGEGCAADPQWEKMVILKKKNISCLYPGGMKEWGCQKCQKNSLF